MISNDDLVPITNDKLAENNQAVLNWAINNNNRGFIIKESIEDIPNGTRYYEVSLVTLLVDPMQTKTNNSRPTRTDPSRRLFIMTGPDDVISKLDIKNDLLESVGGGKRRMRCERKTKKRVSRKSRRHRKSRRN